MQVALVTGGSSGIGRGTALRIAARGMGVILTYGGNEQGALDTVSAIEKDGGTAVALPLDLARSETFPAFRDAVVGALRETWQVETLAALVNNAGFAQTEPFGEATEEVFDRLYAVLLKGPYFLTQTLLPLIADHGAIVNVSSNSSMHTNAEPGYSGYATMKGGLNVMTRFLAKELSPRGIRVNAVAPGSTLTRLGGDAFDKYPEVIPALAAKTAFGRVGDPDDIGQVIAALISDETRWVTAQVLEASGGFGL
ncbi:SDR family NAD(P)-dependent oxidoreductase [Kribbella endophytica]